MKARLLLDSHVPAAVGPGVRALLPSVDIQHVSVWQGGAYVNTDDPLLLEACFRDSRALISKDRATLPGWIALRVADGKGHGGIVFYDSERFKAHQVGALAKALVAAVRHTNGNFANRWITLR